MTSAHNGNTVPMSVLILKNNWNNVRSVPRLGTCYYCLNWSHSLNCCMYFLCVIYSMRIMQVQRSLQTMSISWCRVLHHSKLCVPLQWIAKFVTLMKILVFFKMLCCPQNTLFSFSMQSYCCCPSAKEAATVHRPCSAVSCVWSSLWFSEFVV